MRIPCRAAAVALPLFSLFVARVADAAGAAATPPEVVIRKTVDDAFAVLKDKSLTGVAKRSQRIAALRKIADRTFDWSEMARSSLGAGWRDLDARQRASFVDVFKDLLAAQYMDDIDRFQGTETVTVDSTSREGDESVVHTTLVTASHERVPIDYRMAVRDNRWMVVDLSIEGVSLVNHFRKTFAGALANTKPDELIDRLRKQLPPELSKAHSAK